MRKFLEEAGESSDEEEVKEGATKRTESEEDKLSKVDEKVKELRQKEEAEVKRFVWSKTWWIFVVILSSNVNLQILKYSIIYLC